MKEEIELIVDGWKNLIVPNPVSEELAKKRLAICVECKPHYKKFPITRCGVCNCYIPASVRSKKKHCLKGKW